MPLLNSPTELRLSLAEQFADVRAISSTVAEYLSSELFKEDFGAYGDFTTEDVLKQCYVILLQELTEYGISFNLAEDELLADWYSAKHIYFLRAWLDSESQLQHLTTNPEDIDRLATILSTDDLDPTEFLQSYTDYLQDKYPQEAYPRYLNYVVPMVTGDRRLLEHFKALLAHLRDIDAAVTLPDLQRAQRYLAKTQQLRDYATRAVNSLLQLPDIRQQANRNKLEKLLREYDRDKIAPATLKIFATIDLDEVPPVLESYKKAQLDAHHARSPHHIEYWIDPAKDPKPIPTLENLMLLVAHHYEPNTSPAEFWEEINHMLEVGAEVFTPEQVQIIERLATQLASTGATTPGMPLEEQQAVSHQRDETTEVSEFEMQLRNWGI